MKLILSIGGAVVILFLLLYFGLLPITLISSNFRFWLVVLPVVILLPFIVQYRLVHPSDKSGQHTLVNAVSHYYKQTNQNIRVRYIHRLDVDTSGLLVFVKTPFLHSYYDYLLKEKKIRRDYYAIVDGVPKRPTGTIHAKIGKDRHHSSRRRVSPTGDTATTHYRVIDTNSSFALLECTLETGRTHQIRVHLQHLGHPIVGDSLYNPKITKRITRHALHAFRITLIHPFTNEPIIIESPMPEDMIRLLKKELLI